MQVCTTGKSTRYECVLCGTKQVWSKSGVIAHLRHMHGVCMLETIANEFAFGDPFTCTMQKDAGKITNYKESLLEVTQPSAVLIPCRKVAANVVIADQPPPPRVPLGQEYIYCRRNAEGELELDPDYDQHGVTEKDIYEEDHMPEGDDTVQDTSDGCVVLEEHDSIWHCPVASCPRKYKWKVRMNVHMFVLC